MLIKRPNVQVEESEGSPEDSTENQINNKKPQRQQLILCTQNCRYNVVKRVCRRMEIKCDPDENLDWDIYWSDVVVPPERISKL